jgi:hypothetical protein
VNISVSAKKRQGLSVDEKFVSTVPLCSTSSLITRPFLRIRDGSYRAE